MQARFDPSVVVVTIGAFAVFVLTIVSTIYLSRNAYWNTHPFFERPPSLLQRWCSSRSSSTSNSSPVLVSREDLTQSPDIRKFLERHLDTIHSSTASANTLASAPTPAPGLGVESIPAHLAHRNDVFLSFFVVDDETKMTPPTFRASILSTPAVILRGSSTPHEPAIHAQCIVSNLLVSMKNNRREEEEEEDCSSGFHPPTLLQHLVALTPTPVLFVAPSLSLPGITALLPNFRRAAADLLMPQRPVTIPSRRSVAARNARLQIFATDASLARRFDLHLVTTQAPWDAFLARMVSDDDGRQQQHLAVVPSASPSSVNNNISSVRCLWSIMNDDDDNATATAAGGCECVIQRNNNHASSETTTTSTIVLATVGFHERAFQQHLSQQETINAKIGLVRWALHEAARVAGAQTVARLLFLEWSRDMHFVFEQLAHILPRAQNIVTHTQDTSLSVFAANLSCRSLSNRHIYISPHAFWS